MTFTLTPWEVANLHLLLDISIVVGISGVILCALSAALGVVHALLGGKSEEDA